MITYGLIASIVLLIYFVITTAVPLAPWNDVSKYSRSELALELGFHLIFMPVAILGIWRNQPGFLLSFAKIYFTIMFLTEIWVWWVPYFRGAKTVHARYVQAKFVHTIKWLPPRADHPIPDANHCILHLLTFITWVLVSIQK